MLPNIMHILMLVKFWCIFILAVLKTNPFSLHLYRVFSRDVTAAILVSQNNETAAMLVSQTSPLGVELFSYANAFFRYNKFAYMLAKRMKTLYK